MKQNLIKFYDDYVATGSNISEHALANGVTNTDCALMLKMGEKYKAEKK